jgi:hypothetical protein
MKVYNVKFITEIMNIMNEEELENISPEGLEEIEGQERIMTFSICAHDFEEANEIAHYFIQDMIGEDSEYTLEGVSPILDESGEILFISNWGMNLDNEEHDDNCPYCAVDACPPDEIMRFKCVCGHDIIVADNGWKEIICNSEDCNNKILREDVVLIKGRWVYNKKENDKEV